MIIGCCTYTIDYLGLKCFSLLDVDKYPATINPFIWTEIISFDHNFSS